MSMHVSDTELMELEDQYLGKTIRINYLDNGDSPYGKSDNERYAGKTGVVDHIDDSGQLFGSWGGLAVIPGVDSFDIIDDEVNEEENFTV